MYRLQIKESALKELKKIPYRIRCQIDEKLQRLVQNPERRYLDIKKMKGHDLYRMRSGDYRIIYQKQDAQLIVLIVTVGHRKEVYR
ncbi:MAG: type II toxin-antitoxin system RelE/ParE family toxin [Deltaproteobacteria bacterium]|nr:MAG: type II toxin-antitoxin system RelE/ParE family toxin [Deltaproteobacteria bacterium]